MSWIMNARRLVLFCTVILTCTSCNIRSSGQYTYESPDALKDGLVVGTLSEVGIDSTLIYRGLNRIIAGKYKEVHSLLIYKDNKLVLEEYFPGHKYKWDGPGHHGEIVSWNREMLRDIKSVTKSITSTCIGIAIENGFIESIHQPIFNYLPDHQHLKTPEKEKITIEHLVTMTSGLEWDEWSAPLSSAKNDIIGIWFSEKDPLTFILEKPLVHPPGSSFTYSGGNMIILGEIIKNATQMEIDKFSEKYLFDPIGIDSANWTIRYPNGVIEAAGSIEMTPRSMLKLGITFLNHGQWLKDRVVSPQWIEKVTTPFPGNHGINLPGVASGKHDYSYSWWLKTYYHSGRKINLYNAGGWGGQKIMILPDLDTVVIFTGGNYTSSVKTFKILERYILPAV